MPLPKLSHDTKIIKQLTHSSYYLILATDAPERATHALLEIGAHIPFEDVILQDSQLTRGLLLRNWGPERRYNFSLNRAPFRWVGLLPRLMELARSAPRRIQRRSSG
jgi:hypothetical protein